ncbi:MAG: dTDP-4-dehydrorhamnose reductase family protein [Vicinamibacteria bacterium]
MLVLGATGMMGHAACLVLRRSHQVFGACRARYSYCPRLHAFLDSTACFDEWNVEDMDYLQEILDRCRPNAVLNCVGLVKQKQESEGAVRTITVNALFPHKLARLCDERGAKLIHLSTDCVFSGAEGLRVESDSPDPVDLYGRSKLLGEITYSPHVTLRTSMIGRQLTGSTGLLEWFLQNRNGKVRGFVHAIFSGLTTYALGSVIRRLVDLDDETHGLYHVSAEPISKYELLLRLSEVLSLGIDVEPFEDFRCDRSLNGERFKTDTGIPIPSWDQMLDDLKEHQRAYRSG